ncbi:hypothetical protein D9758_017166 [Tetrapyrgos nigripes]|uniref:Dienelactone hydrolase domain-containing protein n=1 Tax=Tetrapyrgos nigripes TaxID=182062 RepID=A0A8H5C977_9AGAR|nr:hypothetical protein D9758_017166 [Tetrapyrgos nigripes]
MEAAIWSYAYKQINHPAKHSIGLFPSHRMLPHSYCSRYLHLSLNNVVDVGSNVFVPQVPPSDHIFTSSDVPTGHNVTIAGVSTYVNTPPEGTFDTTRAIVILMDIFWFGCTDNFTDTWAKTGFATYILDYFLGDPFPQEGSIPDDSAVTIGVSGYCFGGLYATRLTQNTITVTNMAHPTRLAPSGTSRQLYRELNSLAEDINEVMVDYVPGYNHTAWAGAGHGFIVSANAPDPIEVAAKEGSFEVMSSWIRAHFV